MNTKAIAVTAGTILLVSGFAVAAFPFIPRNAETRTNALIADDGPPRSFELAQRPPRKPPPSNNDGWGDINPYTFGGWTSGGNAG